MSLLQHHINTGPWRNKKQLWAFIWRKCFIKKIITLLQLHRSLIYNFYRNITSCWISYFRVVSLMAYIPLSHIISSPCSWALIMRNRPALAIVTAAESYRSSVSVTLLIVGCLPLTKCIIQSPILSRIDWNSHIIHSVIVKQNKRMK